MTLVEALLAVTLATLCSSALVTVVTQSVQTTDDAVYTQLASGLADQLLEELASVRFPQADSTRPPATGNRLAFDDLDDYHGWSARPPRNRAGLPPGTDGPSGTAVSRPQSHRPSPLWLSRLTQEVTVERLQEDGTGQWAVVSQHTPLRRVTVRISRTDAQGVTRVLCERIQIFTQVAAAP